ncbi:hypothetical protein [Sphingomonas sp. ERG5]|nr:hypothetical protein [Sphingomonas sp. ERG5]
MAGAAVIVETEFTPAGRSPGWLLLFGLAGIAGSRWGPALPDGVSRRAA